MLTLAFVIRLPCLARKSRTLPMSSTTGLMNTSTSAPPVIRLLNETSSWPKMALGCVLAAAVLASMIHWQVRQGSQGAAADRRNEVWWRRNVAIWGSVPPPAIVKTQLQIELLPGARRMVVEGSHILAKHSDKSIDALPFTVGDSFEGLRWAVNGRPVAAIDHFGMKILKTPAP